MVLVLSDNPGMVAFHYVHSFLDWQDIVYDPSGEIIAINTWDEKRSSIHILLMQNISQVIGIWRISAIDKSAIGPCACSERYAARTNIRRCRGIVPKLPEG